MRSKLFLLAAIFAMSATALSQSAKPDTLYFCREYKDGKEVGLASEFELKQKDGSITVMLRTAGPVRESHATIRTEKTGENKQPVKTSAVFDIQPEWDYIFFDGIKFSEEGIYKVTLNRENGDEVVSNFVKIKIAKEK